MEAMVHNFIKVLTKKHKYAKTLYIINLFLNACPNAKILSLALHSAQSFLNSMISSERHQI